MWTSLQAPLFFGLIAAFVTTVGLIVVAQRGDWSARNAHLFGLAAAGMLTTMAFLHILPEAFLHSSNAPTWLAIGFFGGLVLNFAVRAIFPERPGNTRGMDAFTPIMAIAIHSFIDGVVYSVTFAASFSSGVYTAVGLTLHEFPEGVIAYAILRRHGVSNRNAFIWAFLASALTTPLGVVVSAPFMYGLGEDSMGALFAVSAGLLIYVATGPLMAPLREVAPKQGLPALATGIAAAAIIASLPLTDHQHGPSIEDSVMPQPHAHMDAEPEGN